LYRNEPALYEYSFDSRGFEWIDADDSAQSVFAYHRKGKKPSNNLIVVINLTPVPRKGYTIGMEKKGNWSEIFTSDALEFYGTGNHNSDILIGEKITGYHHPYSIKANLPALSCIVLKRNTKIKEY
jgi:1,4-alpha-glucan branching enzyme